MNKSRNHKTYKCKNKSIKDTSIIFSKFHFLNIESLDVLQNSIKYLNIIVYCFLNF
jgi:hypothetical protein